MSNPQTPIETPLIERDKQELVNIIGRYGEELRWYVDERNRLLEIVEKPHRLQQAADPPAPEAPSATQGAEINHVEALELAQMKQATSNLARCYLDLRKQASLTSASAPKDKL